MQVTKRNGELQKQDLQKIHAVLTWACSGHNDDALAPIKGVSVSQIEMQAQLHFYDKMNTKDIHSTLIRAASELISTENPNYDHVAARLVWFAVRKEAFKNNLPPHLRKIIYSNIERGVYSDDIIKLYDDDEIDELNNMIRHERDDLFRYAGSEQMRKKYLVQDRRTKTVYESFQIPYILVSAILFGNYPKEYRMKYVKRYYDLISTHFISLPTPIMAGLRTKVKQFSSCVLISSDDSLDSINATAASIVMYASRKAGIGVDMGRIRALGQSVRNGDAVTTGIVPFAKYFSAALKSCSQGAVRGASATFNWPIFHLEFERLIELKNEKGTEETRIRNVDYCVHINGTMYKRWATKGKITFFSPEEVPDLFDAFYSDDLKKFEDLYVKYENDPTKKKSQMNAADVFKKILAERFETGRIFILHADLVNKQTPFFEPITMTNLCCEITLPTIPLSSDENKGRIALCSLSAVNWGKFGDLSTEKEQKHFSKVCEMSVRGLDALLSYQKYPRKEAELSTMEYRPLGIGLIGLSHWMTKNNLIWGKEDSLEKINNMMESMAFYLTKASILLAKEQGPCKKRTKYSDGWMPMDDSPIKMKTNHNWNEQRELAKQYGIRNATLMALMPSETSSQLANETNGIEPPASLLSIKESKDGELPQLVPEYNKLNHAYQKLWDIPASEYLKTVAVLQRYIDQSMSSNTSYDPNKFDNGVIPMSVLAKDLLNAYKLGIKTLYYNKIRDQLDENGEDDGCSDGACKI